MKKENKKIFIVLILIFLTLVFAGVMTFLSCEEAHAEYLDIITDPQTIVNFNQLVLDQYTHDAYLNLGSGSTRVTITNNDLNITGTNYYYIKYNVSDSCSFYYFDTTFHNYMYLENSGSFIAILENINQFDIVKSSPVTLFSMCIINLTQMFGSGNEPNLEQSNNLFTAQYYNYTNGTPLSLGSLNAYQQALIDIMGSYSYSLNISALGLNSYAYNYQNSDAYFQYDATYNYWYFLNMFGTPLFTTLDPGTRITIDYNFWAPSDNPTDNYLAIGAMIDNNFSIIFTSDQTIDLRGPQSDSFVLPASVNALYFGIYDSTTRAIDKEANLFVIDFNIKADVIDLTTAITNSYLSGQQSTLSKYRPGGSVYDAIYNLGFADGANNSANGSIFTDGWSWIGTMFHSVGEIFSMTLLPGIPLGLFVALPLLLGLIFFIVRVSKGGGE